MQLVNRKKYSDADFINGIITDNDTLLKALYRLHFPMILNFILNNNGNEDDAKDIYQEGIIALCSNIKNGIFKKESKIKTYLYSICRRLWLTELRVDERYSGEINDYENVAHIEDGEEESISEDMKKYNIMDKSLKQLGEPCGTVLKDFYINKLSMKEIADKMNYTNTDNAKTQKHKCLQRLRKIFFPLYIQNTI